MTIKIKARQQFYSLYLAFFLFVSLLLLSFYSLFTLKVYQLSAQASQSDLIIELLPQDINLLLTKLDIAASYANFYNGLIVLITIYVLMLIALLFRLNLCWEQTYISHINFVHQGIAHYRKKIKGELTSDDNLSDSSLYNEQRNIAEFFVQLVPHTNEATDNANTCKEVTTLNEHHKLIDFPNNEVLENVLIENKADPVAHDPNIAELEPLANSADRILLLNELKNKIIRMMLQNQAEYLTQKLPVLSSYNQLNRLLSWTENSLLKEELSNNVAKNQTTTVCLQTQVLACIHNVSTRTNAQKISVQYFDKLPYLYTIDVGVDLLNSVICHTVDLIIMNQRNVHLMLTLKIVEQAHDNSTIRYQFNIFNDKETPRISPIVEELHTESKNTAVKSLQLLLKYFNAVNLKVDKEETGYTVSFDVQHKISEYVNKTTSSLVLNTIYLTDYTDVRDTDNIYTQSIVHDALSMIKGELILTNDIDKALQHLSATAQKLQTIELIVVHTINMFNTLTKFIHTLPKALQPTVHLLQDTCKYLTEVSSGVTPQLLAPFNKYQFIDDIKASLQNTSQPNSIISINTIEQAGFITMHNKQRHSIFLESNIEVLITISTDRCVIKLLRLMGFNITITAGKEETIQQWQTGKYLLLFCDTELSLSVDLVNGKQVKRAIFSSNEDFINTWQVELKEHSKPWALEYLAKNFDLSDLKERLSYWLKTKEGLKDKPECKAEVKSKTQVTTHNILKASDHLSHHMSEVAATDSQDIVEHQKNTNNGSQIEVYSTQTLHIFNIEDFTNKQLSPEFSILLLEEFEAENNQLFNSINNLLIEKSYIDALEPLQKLLNNVSTLSASNLVHATKALINAIENESYQKITLLTDNLNEQIRSFLKVIEH